MNPPRLAVYLHAYLVKDWRAVLAEILAALEASELYLELDALHLGMVGDQDSQAQCVRQVQSLLPVEVVAAAPVGWEQVTLAALGRDAQRNEWDACAYVHLKGVANPSPWADAWRRAMVDAVLTHWEVCTKLLHQVQAVGCHWLAPEMDLPHPVEHPYFAGNMWWARRSYLATLDPPLTANRHDGEAWMGSNRPTVADLCAAGWPSEATLFRTR